MNIVERLREHLLSEGVELNAPCTETELSEFEFKYNVILPPDLRAYFLCFNGSGLGNFIESGYAFATLDEFRPWKEEYDLNNDDLKLYSNCFVIADYMIWCWGYVIDLTPNSNTVYNVPDEKYPNNIVANNFTDFIELYLSNPDEIL